MKTHPSSVEVGDDAVEIDAQTHRDTLRLRRWTATALLVATASLSAACGGDSVEPERSYTIRLTTDDSEDRYRFVAQDPIDVKVGDEVTFDVSITGLFRHDLQVVAPNGDVIGTAPVANPGDSTSVTVLFTEAGPFRLNCLIDNHLTEHNMQAFIEVTDT